MNRSTGMAIRLAALAAMAAVLAAGCQHRGGADEKPGLLSSKPYPFVPANGRSGARFDKGSYPDLLGPGSYAVWSGPELAAAANGQSAEAAPAMNSNFLVIECRLESTFADMSIAYDAVGMRGLNVYIQTPDGRQVAPAQKIVGADLEETPRGALRQFARTNTLIFARAELGLLVKKENLGSTVRLVLEGYNSTYYFEWFPVLPERMPSRLPEQAGDAAKSIYGTGKKSAEYVYHHFY